VVTVTHLSNCIWSTTYASLHHWHNTVISENLVFLAPQRSENLKNLKTLKNHAGPCILYRMGSICIESPATMCYYILPTRTQYPETVTQAFDVKFVSYVYTSYWANENVTVNIQASMGPSGEPVSKYHNMSQWAMDSWCCSKHCIQLLSHFTHIGNYRAFLPRYGHHGR
jgi:hypothetical protein